MIKKKKKCFNKERDIGGKTQKSKERENNIYSEEIEIEREREREIKKRNSKRKENQKENKIK